MAENPFFYRLGKWWFNQKRKRPISTILLGIFPIFWPCWFYRKTARNDAIFEHVTQLARQAVASELTSHQKKAIMFELRTEFQSHNQVIHAYLDHNRQTQRLPLHARELMTLLAGPLLTDIYTYPSGINAFYLRYRDQLAILPSEVITNSPTSFRQGVEMPSTNILSYEGMLRYVFGATKENMGADNESSSLQNRIDLAWQLIQRHKPDSCQLSKETFESLVKQMGETRRQLTASSTSLQNLTQKSSLFQGLTWFFSRSMHPAITLNRKTDSGNKDTPLNKELECKHNFFQLIQKPFITQKPQKKSTSCEVKTAVKPESLAQVARTAMRQRHSNYTTSLTKVYNASIGDLLDGDNENVQTIATAREVALSDNLEDSTNIGKKQRHTQPGKRDLEHVGNLDPRKKIFLNMADFFKNLFNNFKGSIFFSDHDWVWGITQRLYELVSRSFSEDSIKFDADVITVLSTPNESMLSAQSLSFDMLRSIGILAFKQNGQVYICAMPALKKHNNACHKAGQGDFNHYSGGEHLPKANNKQKLVSTIEEKHHLLANRAAVLKALEQYDAKQYLGNLLLRAAKHSKKMLHSIEQLILIITSISSTYDAQYKPRQSIVAESTIDCVAEVLFHLALSNDIASLADRLHRLSPAQRLWFCACVKQHQGYSKNANKKIIAILDILESIAELGITLPDSFSPDIEKFLIQETIWNKYMNNYLSSIALALLELKYQHGKAGLSLQNQYISIYPLATGEAQTFIDKGAAFVHDAMLLDRTSYLADMLNNLSQNRNTLSNQPSLTNEITNAFLEKKPDDIIRILENKDHMKSDNALDNINITMLRKMNIDFYPEHKHSYEFGNHQPKQFRETDIYETRTFLVCQAIFLRFIAQHYSPKDIQELIRFWESQTNTNINKWTSIDFERCFHSYSATASTPSFTFNSWVWKCVLEKMETLSEMPQLEVKSQPSVVAGTIVKDGVVYVTKETHSEQSYAKVIVDGNYDMQKVDSMLDQVVAPDFLKHQWRQQLQSLNIFNEAIDKSDQITTIKHLKNCLNALKILHKDLQAIKTTSSRKLLKYASLDAFNTQETCQLFLEDAQKIPTEEKVTPLTKEERHTIESNVTHIKNNLNLAALALLRQIKFQSSGDKQIWLRPEQALVVMQALSGVNSSFQVKTGEGKTVINAMIAVLSAISGNQVVVTTCNNILAKEAKKESYHLAKHCGLTVHLRTKPSAQPARAHITHQTNETAAMSTRMQAYALAFLPETKPLELKDEKSTPHPIHAIHDEDDQTHYLDEASTDYLGTASTCRSAEESQILMKFLQKIIDFNKSKPSNQALADYLKNDEYYNNLQPEKQASQLTFWQAAYTKAEAMRVDIDYMISEPDPDGARHIQLISIGTGVIQPSNCHLQAGIHQILAMRERLGGKAAKAPETNMPQLSQDQTAKRFFTAEERKRIVLPTENTTMYQTSAAAYSRSVDFITGLSGTTGDRFGKQPQLLKQLFGASLGVHIELPEAWRKTTDEFSEWTQMRVANIEPTYHEEPKTHKVKTVYSRRFIQEAKFVANKQQYFETLFNAIQAAQTQDQEFDPRGIENGKANTPPVLAIFKTIEEVHQFYDYCISHGLTDVTIYDGVFPEESKVNQGARLPEALVLQKSKRGTLVLGTFLAGRGVDFKGLRYAFIPHGLEDSMLQSSARAARNMGKGVVTPIINLEAMAEDMGKLGIVYDPDLSPKFNFRIYQAKLEQQNILAIVNKRACNQILDQLQNVFFAEFHAAVKEDADLSDPLKQAWSDFFSIVSGWPRKEFSNPDNVTRKITALAEETFQRHQPQTTAQPVPMANQTPTPLQDKLLEVARSGINKFKCIQAQDRQQHALALAAHTFFKTQTVSPNDDAQTPKGKSTQQQKYMSFMALNQFVTRAKIDTPKDIYLFIDDYFPHNNKKDNERFKQLFNNAKFVAKHDACLRNHTLQLVNATSNQLDQFLDEFEHTMRTHASTLPTPQSKRQYLALRRATLGLLKQYKFEILQKLNCIQMTQLLMRSTEEISYQTALEKCTQAFKQKRAKLSDMSAITAWLQSYTGCDAQAAKRFVQQPTNLRAVPTLDPEQGLIYQAALQQLIKLSNYWQTSNSNRMYTGYRPHTMHGNKNDPHKRLKMMSSSEYIVRK